MKGYVFACPHCHEWRSVRKHGKTRSGLQRYYCSECRRTFQIKYIYQIDKGKSETIKPSAEMAETC
ncbi:IS1/IS1595 family N-terminal zinc-binding domain-containing protein [Budvicia aquatica]|uniref:Transposase and inactivated derivatives n=2 Tax=Budvicia aquatica TaxID=82979 RepID=A0A2C6DKL6_9GAMM|nr:hypothetical protein CRN84_08535 [Budvicia aquatica]VFS47616.1 Transposase and inactivated derivatives [Budvicia aquatica]